MIQVEQQRRAFGEIAVVVEDAERDGVRLAVVECAGERGEVYAIGNKVERLRTGRRHPHVGKKSSKDPRRDGRNSGKSAVDRDFSLTEVSISASVDFI